MIVSLSIRRDGSLSDVELNKGSGNSGINKRILSELREAKPFQVLPSAISKDIDVLVVTFRLPVE
jgi:outer membrane biosynthesis protein TonB